MKKASTAIATLTDLDEQKKDVRIDLGNLSYEDAMRMAILDSTMGRLSILQERSKIGEPSAAALDEMLELSKPAAMENIFRTMREQMAKVVKAIPDAWFVDDAPADLPLNDPETYRWLRADRARDLRKMIAQAEKDAKN